MQEARAADPKGASALSQIVELMATSRDRAVAAAEAIARARQALAAVPDGLIGQVESMRDAMQTRIEKYGPLLDTYVEVSARLPTILGWDGSAALPRPDSGPGGAPSQRRVHRELRNHRVRPRADHRAPLHGHRPA